uniref:Kappa-casein n=1 Tax=Nannospalax galili TaxID=1026970 RepID=A0A8C6QRQ3_NANGA
KMRNFILLVNILALTLPFLAAEVQNQDPACHGKEEYLYNQKRVLQIPIQSVLNSSPHYEPSYYQHRASMIVNPYKFYPYFVKLLLLRPPIQIVKWQFLPNIPQPVTAPYPIPHPQFLAIPTKENQDKPAIPAISTMAPAEPTPAPTVEPVVNTVVSSEASSGFINNSETSTVLTSSPVA